MPTISRKPKGSLQAFVRVLWASTGAAPSSEPARRELVLPAGTAHLVFRLDEPLRTFSNLEADNACFVGHQILGGPRAAPYIRETSRAANTVGVELSPGALSLVLGDRADLFAHRHFSLADIWGKKAQRLAEHLAEIANPEARLTRFETFLEEHFSRRRELHPIVRHALFAFQTQTSVHAVALATGYSERRLSTLFREAVGLPPKLYLRLQRFQSALTAIHASTTPVARIALVGGYADQAHFSREFREFAGVSPQNYRKIAPLQARHVPLPI